MNPRTSWEQHPNFAGPAGTLLAIHDQFRVAAERLVLMVDREPEEGLGWVGRAFVSLAQTLHHHHHAEEQMLFPFVEKRTGSAPEDLVAEHGELTQAIEGVERSLGPGATKPEAQAAAARFRTVLALHLDREEAKVVPVLLEVKPAEAWAMIHGE